LVLPRRTELDRDEHHHRKMELLDVLLAMNGAWLINSAMVVMAAAVFFGGGLHVYSIEAAHDTLVPLLGKLAGVRVCAGAFMLGIVLRDGGNDGGVR
jgi:manganese transport protein